MVGPLLSSQRWTRSENFSEYKQKQITKKSVFHSLFNEASRSQMMENFMVNQRRMEILRIIFQVQSARLIWNRFFEGHYFRRHADFILFLNANLNDGILYLQGQNQLCEILDGMLDFRPYLDPPPSIVTLLSFIGIENPMTQLSSNAYRERLRQILERYYDGQTNGWEEEHADTISF